MSQTITKSSSRKISIPVSLDDLAERIWQMPKRERESLEELLEEKFVHTVLRRAKEIPRLQKQGKLLSFDELKREFSR